MVKEMVCKTIIVSSILTEPSMYINGQKEDIIFYIVMDIILGAILILIRLNILPFLSSKSLLVILTYFNMQLIYLNMKLIINLIGVFKEWIKKRKRK